MRAVDRIHPSLPTPEGGTVKRRSGRGPGSSDRADGADVAPDGSPVDFYRRLPAAGEPELIHAVIKPSATVLDLGCGAGRIAGPLVALGHAVTGVDNGRGMIAALPPGVEGVVADAGTVRLGRRFGAVLLASHLVNDPEAGAAFVATAAAHLEATGVLVGETYPPGWEPSSSVGRTTHMGDAWVELLWATVEGDQLAAEVRYGVDDRVWQQAFGARILGDAGLRELLGSAGLAFDRWLPRPGWFLARPRSEEVHVRS
jgi:SAM-dependent methyltransferase